MSKKIYFTLKICLIIMLLFIIALTIIKMNYKTLQTKDSYINEVGELVYYDHNINYKEVYKDNIIYDIVSEIPYSIIDENGVLYGKIVIGEDGNLYITNDIIDNNYLVLDKKIKTLYDSLPDSELPSFHVLTIDGEIYHITLDNSYIDKSSLNIKKYYLHSKATNFTTLSINNFLMDASSNVVVLCEDENMYDLSSKILYSNDIVKVMNEYVIYGNGHVTTTSNNILVDANNNEYCVKTVIALNENVDELSNSPTIVLITSDDRLIYLIEDDKVCEYFKKVKAVYLEENIINIVFEDDSVISFNGYYNKDFYPIFHEKLDENIVDIQNN